MKSRICVMVPSKVHFGYIVVCSACGGRFPTRDYAHCPECGRKENSGYGKLYGLRKEFDAYRSEWGERFRISMLQINEAYLPHTCNGGLLPGLRHAHGARR